MNKIKFVTALAVGLFAGALTAVPPAWAGPICTSSAMDGTECWGTFGLGSCGTNSSGQSYCMKKAATKPGSSS